MLLILIRFTMIVPLLVSAVRVEASQPEYLPFEKQSQIQDESRRSSSLHAFVNRDERSVRDEDPGPDPNPDPNSDSDSSFADKGRIRKNDRYSDDEESKVPRGGLAPLENRFPRSGGGGLAHKMAKDALKSPKIQETINKLSHVASPKGGVRGGAKGKGGSTKISGGKGRRSGGPRKVRRKKKRKRHHRRFRKPHSGSPNRRSSKRTPASIRDTRVAVGSAAIKRDDVALDENPSSATGFHAGSTSRPRSREKVNSVEIEDNDYADLSTAPFTAVPPIRDRTKHFHDDPAKLRGGGTMIEQLMRTTTRDPRRKSGGDLGVEYTDYYSDDEVLENAAAGKVAAPNDRYVRQALNTTSRRAGCPVHRSSRYHRDYDPRRKKVGHDEEEFSWNSPRDSSDPDHRSSSLKRRSRLSGDGESSRSLPLNFHEPVRYGNNENSYRYRDAYPVNDVHEIPEPFDGGSDPRYSHESDANRLEQEFQQSPLEEAANNFDRYENPLERTANQAGDHRVHRFSTAGNYPSADANLMENLDTAVPDQASMDDIGVPDAKEDDEPRTRLDYSPVRSYEEEEQQQPEQVSDSLPLQTKHNLPAADLPNAMDQPLGKILETLGIDVNNAGLSQNSNLKENINHPVSAYYNPIERPMEHVISPSYIKKKPLEGSSNYYEASDAGGSDYQAAAVKDGNRAGDGYARRESNRSGVSRLDSDKSSPRNSNISIAVQDTKEVAGQILDTIMEELQELKADKSRNDKREGLPCRLSGSWSTAQAGMKLDMRVVNRSIIVTVSDLASPRFHETLLNGTWNVSGHAPFKRGSPFTLIATDNKTNSMAVFVGACRVCQGVDTIAGVWSVARQPKDCRDFQVSTSVFNDIFRKTQLSSLKEKSGTNTTEETTLKHEKRKG